MFVGGALVAIGMILSYTSTSFISGQVLIKEVLVNSTTPVEIQRELDPLVMNKGAFVVIAERIDNTKLVSTIISPSGITLTKEITKTSTQEYFDVDTKGVYTLQVKNDGMEIPLVLGLSYMEDKLLVALGLLGKSMIMTGFIGVAVFVIYTLKTRKKSS